ncbi:hypothetical protein BABINDRAFT_86414 [Babjeviella inositovora NRRL Y-12698]|uniref:Uncharacterized protein n=1 Tax=Babjeviella inositovora NRRL Y-12698 TaxID=984486 RepID=A0A1E3QLJ6_9ASCO|nr:uncharacterized protein BABINDRAFT_86414 [Babjeviella inositovora NRRL Y-12698]ODQ78561.1 hypothetical protein BABINDRAFT_86414 [Babjeviella inositovora NRRL Y-12698]
MNPAETTRIFRTPVTPRKGDKLGKAATWTKVKVTASSVAASAVARYQHKKASLLLSPTEPVDDDLATPPNLVLSDEEETSGSASPSSPSSSPPRPDFLKAKPFAGDVMEQDSEYPFIEFGTAGEVFVAYQNAIQVWDWFPATAASAGGTLYLAASHRMRETGTIVSITPLQGKPFVLLVQVTMGKHILVNVTTIGGSTTQLLRETASAPYHIFSHSKSHFVVVDANGKMHVYDRKSLQKVGFGLPNQAKLDPCSFANGNPLCSLAGKWLAYCPGKASEDTKRNVTPVKLPPPGPLLNRVISSISAATIDGVFKVSEASSRKIGDYFSRDQQEKSSASPSSTHKYLKDTLTKLFSKETPEKAHKRVVVVDLSNGRTLGVLRPPGGDLSYLSLSPYDAHLVTANKRGDALLYWDLSKLPSEFSFLGKYIRGKTASIIDSVCWGGGGGSFGITTRASGSIHWFSTNLSEPPDDHSWILSSFGVTRMCLGPRIATLSSGDYKAKHVDAVELLHHQRSLQGCLLAVLDGVIKVVSPTDGSCSWQYALPEASGMVAEASQSEGEKEDLEPYYTNPLAQAEIETCLPYPNLFNNRKVQFSIYDFQKNLGAMDSGMLSMELLVDGSETSRRTGRGDSYRFIANYSRDGGDFGKGFAVQPLRFGKHVGDPQFFSEAETNEEKGIAEIKRAMEDLLFEPEMKPEMEPEMELLDLQKLDLEHFIDEL